MKVKKSLAILLTFTVFILFFLLISTEINQPSAGLDSGRYMISGVLDRFENNQAVIIMEDIQKQITIPESHLLEGIKENMWLYLANENGKYNIVDVNYEKTKQEWMRTKQLMEILRE